MAPIPVNSGRTYRIALAEPKPGGWCEYLPLAPRRLPRHALPLQPKRDAGWEGGWETLLKEETRWQDEEQDDHRQHPRCRSIPLSQLLMGTTVKVT